MLVCVCVCVCVYGGEKEGGLRLGWAEAVVTSLQVKWNRKRKLESIPGGSAALPRTGWT